MNQLHFSYLDSPTGVDLPEVRSEPYHSRNPFPVKPNPFPVRNPQIEERIKYRRQHEYNPYGGMGMDGNTKEVLQEKHEELEYMKYWEVYSNILPMAKRLDLEKQGLQGR